jgi:5-methylcytosine-specific restriction endonuclease McrA
VAWFRVDDKLGEHPKVRAIPRAHRRDAMGLWVLAGAWCASNVDTRHGEDGNVPAWMVEELCGEKVDADRLAHVGLWHTGGHDCEACPQPVDPDGWIFHEWASLQYTREEVRAKRASDAARQKVARSPELRAAIRDRDRDRCRYCGVVVRWNDRRGPHGGTYDHVVPDGPSDLANLVVACRGCNSSKGRRTPEQAGMRLQPVPDDDPDQDPPNRSSSDPDRSSSEQGGPSYPSRPDPSRPQSVVNHGGQRYETFRASDATKPPRCNAHAHLTADDDPGPCRGCMKAREAAEAAQAGRRADAQANRDNCARCGGTGWLEDADGSPVEKCDHRPLLELVKDGRR